MCLAGFLLTVSSVSVRSMLSGRPLAGFLELHCKKLEQLSQYSDQLWAGQVGSDYKM
jgi:hypothetical protein